MPYKNIPESKTEEMDRCVEKVKKNSPDVDPYAVCYSSIMDKMKKNKKKENK